MSVAPDEAMSQLYAGLRPPAQEPQEQPGPALELGARLEIALDKVSTALTQSRRRFTWDECHLVDIAPAQSAAAGVLDPTDIWGPRQGFVWHVLLVAAILGPSGTSMTLYRDAATPVNTVLTSTVSGLFEPSGLYLMPGRRMVWSSAGDALTVCAGIAAEIDVNRLPDYLMRHGA